MSEEIKEKQDTGNANNQSAGTNKELTAEERFKKSVEKIRPYAEKLWAARKKFIIFNAAVLIIVLVYLIFFTKPYFQSRVNILPDYGNKETSLSQLSSLASLAGVNVGGAAPTDIYQKLLLSESVMTPVIYSKYKTQKFSGQVDLIQYFKVRPDKNLPPDLRMREMFLSVYNMLIGSRIATTIDRTTRILTVQATMPEAQLSADVVNKAVESLDNYVRTKRKSYASDQRQYIEKRISQVSDSLNTAENLLARFKEQNRIIDQSPQLQLQMLKLTRNVQILNSVFMELSKQLELAKIDEVKDTPIVNVEELAQSPIIKAGPRRLNSLVIIMALSVLFSGSYFMFKDLIVKYFSVIRIIAPQSKSGKSGNKTAE